MVDESTNNFVSLVEVKNILKKLEKEREELTYEQRIALEHAHAFTKLTLKQTKDLIKDLKEVESIETIHAYKIADLLPTNEDALKSIFAKERMNLGENDIKKILNIVQKYYIE